MRRLMMIGAVSLLFGGAAAAKNPAPEDMTGHKEHAMANCPSAVEGAKTAVENRKDGVTVTVTATDPARRDEIRRRAHVQQTVAMQPARGALEHTGEGTGSGKFGFCPGMVQGTTVTVDDVADGARLIVRADSAARARSLQKTTVARVREMSPKH